MTQLPDAAESEKGTALIFADSITDSDDTTEWNGLIYNGSNGKIYGNSFILKQNTIIPAEKDITIEEGQIMTIEEDCILNLDAGTGFVNEGTLEVKGMLINHSENDIGKVEGNGQVHTDTDFDGICDDKDCTEKDFRTVNIEGERTINSQGLGEFSLLATVSCIGDTDEKAVYQWYEKDSEGEYNAIKGATATTCSIKKDASGIYEFYLEVTRGSIVQRLPVTVNVNKTRCKVSLTSSLDGDDSEETVALLTGGGLYDTGDSVTVTAYPKDGFVFYEWISETYDEEGDIIWETKSQNPVYTFTASEDVNLVARYRANAKKNLEITGERNSYKVNGVLQGNDVYQKRMKAGSEVTLSYNGTKEFCYWKNDSGKIVSRDINYTFNLVVDTKLTAVTAETGGVTPDNGYLAMVEFISGYGQVMQAETWSSTDNVEKRKLPEAPSRFGGIFRYWSLDGVTQATVETILAAINGTNYHLVLEPVYEMVTTTYSVTVKYPEGSGKEDVLHGNIKAGNTIVVTAQELEGKVFAYWAGDSEGTKILSYEKDYRVRLTDNITLYAIYSDAEVEAKPVIALTNVYKSELGEQKKVSIEVTRSVSDNYEVMETGVLVLFCDEYKEDYYMSVNNSAVRKVTAISTDNQGIYTLNINVTKNPDKKIAARGYMILKDKETCKLTVHYSEIAVTSYNQIP